MTQYGSDALRYLADRPLSPLAGVALNAVVVLVKWQDLARTRRALDKLPPHILRDVGLTDEQARTEAKRPFWDCPPHWQGPERR